eukprot:762589-Hanusia_phi.AAC.1
MNRVRGAGLDVGRLHQRILELPLGILRLSEQRIERELSRLVPRTASRELKQIHLRMELWKSIRYPRFAIPCPPQKAPYGVIFSTHVGHLLLELLLSKALALYDTPQTSPRIHSPASYTEACRRAGGCSLSIARGTLDIQVLPMASSLRSTSRAFRHPNWNYDVGDTAKCVLEAQIRRRCNTAQRVDR